MDTTVETIKQTLVKALQPESVEVIDDSADHAGHAGAKTGKGHYTVRIVSAEFEGKTLVQRHQMVYQILGDLMETHIHALRIDARGLVH